MRIVVGSAKREDMAKEGGRGIARVKKYEIDYKSDGGGKDHFGRQVHKWTVD